jgi:hypothetical protein
MVLELMFQIYLIPLPRSAILFKEVWYARRMLLDYCYSSSGVLKHV